MTASQPTMRCVCLASSTFSALLEYRKLFPQVVGKALDAAHSICCDKIGSAISKEDVQQLAYRVMELLREIARVLKQAEPGAALAA
ncbi:MAG TPA: hypothetical protein VJT08_04235 [Terriglobales bacterium]|nr:hypothetical protein [Terriglobales bacterium]